MMVESPKKGELNQEDDGSENDEDEEDEDDDEEDDESGDSSRSRARSRSNSPSSQSKDKVLFITSFGDEDEDEEEEAPKVVKKPQPPVGPSIGPSIGPSNIPTCEFKPDLYDACINAKLLKENVGTARSRSASPTRPKEKWVWSLAFQRTRPPVITASSFFRAGSDDKDGSDDEAALKNYLQRRQNRS